MAKIYTKTIILFLLAFGIKANAQCTGCTINVTGLDVANHIVSSGQTMCVSATGTLTGLITVSTGGSLCNQGKISSTNVWIAGGTFKNYGTIDTYSVTISSAGTFTNYATALIDSLWITQANTTYINNGTQTGTAFAITENASAINSINGSITVFNFGDSLGTFTNNGNITINNNFANAYTSIFNNNGNVTVNNDFANSFSSTFTNNNYMKINRDFYNSTSATFWPKCMMLVNRDWYNSAYIYGPSTGCGGFNVTGGTFNNGTLGFAGAPVDMCDAGHPALGLDGPGGTINPNTTYCSCTNSCVGVTTGIKEVIKESNVLIENIFPNPTSNNFTIKLNNKQNEVILIEVRDMMGKTILTKSLETSIGDNETQINVSNLTQGTYILNITDSHQLQSKRLFSVVK